MRRLAVLIGLAGVACSDAGTDPNAVVAVRFDGSAYPSIVAGDSLRDSLGVIQPLKATGLNYKSEPVAGAAFVFSSPDTILRMFTDGVVFARGRKPDGTPARVFATSGSLQSQPDSLVVVPRADSMKVVKDVDTLLFDPGAGSNSAPDVLGVQLLGDTLASAPKAPVPAWLVSFQLSYRGTLIPPTDTSFAFTGEVNSAKTARFASFVDTTDAQGRAGRRVFVRSLSTSAIEDTIFLIATMRKRQANTLPASAKTMILLRHK
jgi:hypothetical protein